jgi:aryl-alcohol dehydrogenase-like predicted oxidoreductase
MNMMMRSLGRSGMAVSALGLGCWAIGGPFWRGDMPSGWGEVDDAESMRAIHAALDAGVTFFDTSDVYGAGHSERVLGEALQGRRSSVVIATKWGSLFDEQTRQITGADPSPAYVAQACEASLRRLRTDYIDVYQWHLGNEAVESVPAVLAALEELVAVGKIRAYAWSTDDPDRARAFAAGAHCYSVQHGLNVLQDAPEMLALCESLGLASINRSPLAMGLLTGKYTAASRLPDNDVRGKTPDWMRYFHDGVPSPEWLARLAAIREVLSSEGRTLAQGALAWLWGRSPNTIPIPGFRTVAQVQENVGALSHGPLAAAQMAEVARLLGRD